MRSWFYDPRNDSLALPDIEYPDGVTVYAVAVHEAGHAVTLYSDGWARDLHDGCGGRHRMRSGEARFQASDLQGGDGARPRG